MLPPVSVPNPNKQPPAPIRAPSPEEEPPGVNWLLRGCNVWPNNGLLLSKLQVNLLLDKTTCLMW